MSQLKYVRKYSFFVGIMVCFLLMIPVFIDGHTVGVKVDDLLLTESDMPGFRLKSQVPGLWMSAKDQIVKGVRQTWASNTSYGEEIMVDICLLDTIPDANKCVHFTRMETSSILSWGSYKGQFLGDKLWLGTNAFSNATFMFFKYNVAVKVGMVKCEPGKMKLMEEVAQKILKKIDGHKSDEPSVEYTKLKSQQISEKQFLEIVSDALESNLGGFKILRRKDDLWLIDEEGNYRLGRGWEWLGEKDMLIGISICSFPTKNEAQKSIEIRKVESYGHIIEGDLSRPEIPEKLNSFESVSSVIFSKDSVAVHIYQFNKKEPDIGLFVSLVVHIAAKI